MHAGGFLRKVWSLPGQKANVGIWSARDADQLTEALQSLPIWPLITLEVTPLATHPLFAEMAREGMEIAQFIGDPVKLSGDDVISTSMDGG